MYEDDAEEERDHESRAQLRLVPRNEPVPRSQQRPGVSFRDIHEPNYAVIITLALAPDGVPQGLVPGVVTEYREKTDREVIRYLAARHGLLREPPLPRVLAWFADVAGSDRLYDFIVPASRGGLDALRAAFARKGLDRGRTFSAWPGGTRILLEVPAAHVMITEARLRRLDILAGIQVTRRAGMREQIGASADEDARSAYARIIAAYEARSRKG